MNKLHFNSLIAACGTFASALNMQAAVFLDISQLPSRPELPDALVLLNGERVTTRDQWFQQRRPELKALFEHYMYGHRPPKPVSLTFITDSTDAKFLDGKATKKEVTIRVGPASTPVIHVLLVVPNQRTQPAPVFLGLNFSGNQAVLPDPSITISPRFNANAAANAQARPPKEIKRGADANSWSVEQIIDRGYALATFHNGDLEPDRPNAEDGIRAFYQKQAAGNGSANSAPYDWGTIAAWAWSLSRAVDYLVTDGDLDAQRIAVVGHSRNGKAALLAGAFDDRIAMSVPIQAGCGGTAPSRGKMGETVKQINNSFPHWFNAEFKKFNEAVDKLPFDQHCLVDIMAPRPVLFLCATEDTWANPPGQFEMLQAAEPVYRLLNAGTLNTQTMPETGHLVDSSLGYFIRPGKHSVTPLDWKAILDYADKNLKPVRINP